MIRLPDFCQKQPTEQLAMLLNGRQHERLMSFVDEKKESLLGVFTDGYKVITLWKTFPSMTNQDITYKIIRGFPLDENFDVSVDADGESIERCMNWIAHTLGRGVK